MNQNIIKRNYINLFSIISLLLFLNGPNYCQWQNTNLPSNLAVNTLAFIDTIIFAGTNGDGIFESTNNGETWISKNTGLQNKVIHTIFIDSTSLPAGKIRIFAGTEAGASVSTDNGESWTSINSGLSDNGVWSFAVSNIVPGNPIIFAGTWSGIYSYTENNTLWKAVGLQSLLMPINSLLVNNSSIYAATAGCGFFVSKNNGSSWRQYPLIFTGDNVSTVDTGIIPVYSMGKINSNVVLGFGLGLIDYMPKDSIHFISCHSYPMRWNPIMSFYERDKILYGGTAGGDILLTRTYGYEWDLLWPSLTNNAIYSLVLNSTYIFAGTENGVWRLWYPGTSTNVEHMNETPTGFALQQNYPNPFNSSTKIKFTIPNSGNVSVKVYNMLGELVNNLVDKYMASGTYEVDFSPTGLSSGIYFYSLVTNEFRSTKKLILMK